MKNSDNERLKWALKSALFPVGKDPQRTSKYPANDGLNWAGIEFPVKVSQISKLENQNKNLAINVWGWENEDLIILHISKKPKEVKRIELMLFTDGKKSHFCWIKHFNRLLFAKTKHNEKQFYCELCLSRFRLESALKNHQDYCDGVNGRPTRIDIPEKGKNMLKFENYQNQQKAPYIIYADFESIIENLPADPKNRTKKMERKSKRYAKANNPQVPGHDPQKPCNHILYFFTSTQTIFMAGQYASRCR